MIDVGPAMKPKIFVACHMLLACAGGTATLADNVVPNVGFHLTETCGPHSSGGAEGWSVARFGELKNGVWVQEHQSISSKDGLLRREKWQLRLGQSGSINFHRSGNRGSATWEGDYTGRISDNYKAINLDGVETNDGVVVRKCTLLVDFDSQPIVKELATNPSHKTQLLSDVLIKDVDLSGSMTCSPPSPWKPGTSVIRGKLNGGYFSQKGGVGDSHGNTATMNVDKSSLTFEWSFHVDDEGENHAGEHHLKKKVSLAVGQVASSFSANMNFRGQQSGEDCDVKLNFAEPPLQNARTAELELNFAEPPLQNAQSIASPAPAVEAVTEKVKAENEVLVAQADVLISKAKSAAVRLTVQFDGFKKLQDSVRKEFQDNINSSIKEIEEKISTLSSAKENKANSDQINQLRSELNDLKNRG